MSVDWSHKFCLPVTELAHPPSAWSAYFNAPGRDGYNPGYRNPGDPEGHGGIDLHADKGTPAVAAHDGQVRWAGPKNTNTAAGIFIEIVERDDRNNGWWLTRYLHLSETLATPGQTVRAGEQIGRVGCTGQCTYPHVHFEIHWLTRPYGEPGTGVSQGVKLDPQGDPTGRWPGFKILSRPCVQAPGWPDRLRRGDQDDRFVPLLKALLVAAGYRTLVDPGITFTRWVEKQVKRFQAAEGLVVDGVVGPETRAALYRRVAATDRP